MNRITYDEFREEAHSMGFHTRGNCDYISIHLNGEICGYVSKEVQGLMSTDFRAFRELPVEQRFQVFEICFRLTITPLEDREIKPSSLEQIWGGNNLVKKGKRK